MPPFPPSALACALHNEVFLSLLDLVRQRLATLLGQSFTVVLAASVDGIGVNQYHLAIQHNRSGLSFEDNGEVEPGFAERLLELGWRMKSMLESETFERMLSDDPVRLVAWISDEPCPAEILEKSR